MLNTEVLGNANTQMKCYTKCTLYSLNTKGTVIELTMEKFNLPLQANL